MAYTVFTLLGQDCSGNFPGPDGHCPHPWCTGGHPDGPGERVLQQGQVLIEQCEVMSVMDVFLHEQNKLLMSESWITLHIQICVNIAHAYIL